MAFVRGLKMPTPPSDLVSAAQPPADLVSPASPPPDLVAPPPAEQDSTLRKIGRNVAAAGDIIAGAPAWLAKMGQTGVTDVIAAVKGDPHPLKSASEATEQDWQNEQFLQAPIETAFGVDPSKTFMGDVGGWMSEHVNAAADAATKQTGNPEHGEAVKQIANIVMAKAGDLVLGIKRGIKADEAKVTAAERMKTAQPTGTQPPADLTEVPAIERRMETRPLPEDSAPVTKGRVEDMRKRKAVIKEGDPVVHPDEGKLDDVLPYKPTPQASQEIHAVLADPALSPSGGTDPLYDRAVESATAYGKASIANIKRSLDIQWGEAERIVKRMQADGIIGEQDINTGYHEFTGKDKVAPVEAARDVAAEKVANAVKADQYRQKGEINKKLLTGIAGIAGGAAVGAAMDKDNAIEGALIGAGAGFGISRVAHVLHDIGAGVSLQSALNVIKPSLDPIRAKAVEVNNAKVANVKAGLRNIAAIQKAYIKAVPSKARREHITHVVQSGDLSSLSPTERYFVSKVEQAYGQMGSAAQEAGVIGHLLGKEYVPMMWDMRDTSTKAFFDDLLSSSAGDQATAGTFTPHSLKRSIPTYLQGMAGNLKPLTLDHAELLGLYAKSVLKATENANALYTLKSMRLPNGLHAVEPVGKGMPRDYITDHKIGGLEGFAVHPEMVDALRIGFDSYRPGVIQKAMLSVAFTAKRLAVTYSMFHPMSLLVAYTGAGGNPFGFAAGAAARGVEKATRGLVNVPFKSAVDKAIEQYEQAGAKDTTDYLIRNGLEIGGGIEDTIGRDSFLKMTGFLDRVLGSEKTGLKPFTAVDENIHQFTWGYTHTGMKLAVAGREFERMLADPKNAGKDINKIAADATSYTNNIFGGLNWERMIEGMKSKAGRAIAGAAYSKHGRAVMQTGLFAPDWLLSTMRSWTQAVPGLSENAAVARMSRAYIARSLLYTMIITDALNYKFSGHHVWQNDFRSQREQDADPDNVNRDIMDQIHDMTYIDMGDGTRIEANKHLFEFVHAITEPAQFGMGKLSSTVTDPLNMAMNRQWLSPTWAPKITEGGTKAQKAKDYAKWLAQHHMPISLQQLGQGAYGGTFGFPRHGKHEDEKQLLNEQRQETKQERDLQ